MAKYSELIKNFDKIRDYMKDFFIYGYKTRTDYEYTGYKSLRTYDDEKRRIESWLKDFIQFDTSKKGKQVSISCSSNHLHENPLYNAYRSKSFTDKDIELHFFIIDALINSPPLSVDEITDKLINNYKVYFEPQTIRLKLNEYVSEGILISSKKGRNLYFTLCTDTPDNISSDKNTFLDMIKFFSQYAPFGVIGNHILKQSSQQNDIFLMKHNFIVHTLEDNIMLDFIKAINEKKYTNIVNFGRNGTNSNIKAVPLRFHISLQTGRQYILIYIDELKRFSTLRLDHIKKIQILDICPDYDKLYEKYMRNLKYCWGTSFGKIRKSGNTEKIKLTLFIDEEKEKFILERLIRESRGGIITHKDKNIYTYETELFDACEASPWIKSFTGRIISLESDSKTLVNRFYNDMKKMFEIYSDKKEK